MHVFVLYVIYLYILFTKLSNIFIVIFNYSFDDYTKIGNIVNSLASRLSTLHLYEQVIFIDHTSHISINFLFCIISA